jgi:hypothetical protein
MSINYIESGISPRLHVGDWVVVRSKEDILLTLDREGRLGQLPFQPEMFAYCGRRLRVAKVAHKTCNNLRVNEGRGRRMRNAVHLEGARCDGSLHDGCQADCVFFWKEAWLRRADAPDSRAPRAQARDCSEADVMRAARAPGNEHMAEPVWVCQTTALYEATEPLAAWDVRQYIRDVTSGNHSAWHMKKLLIAAGYRNLVSLGVGYRFLIGAYNWFQRMRGGRPYPDDCGNIPDRQPTPVEDLNLQPGEWVEVKSPDEIRATITTRGMNRGMRFDMEMLKYCGGRFRVQMRVNKIINEHTGKIMPMKTACIQLEDVYCRAECTHMRLGCPRGSNHYWREIWLQRAPSAGAAGMLQSEAGK